METGQPLVSIFCISPMSSAAVVADQARGGEPLQLQTRDGPSPRNHPLGDGEPIRRALYFRLLSGYLLA